MGHDTVIRLSIRLAGIAEGFKFAPHEKMTHTQLSRFIMFTKRDENSFSLESVLN